MRSVEKDGSGQIVNEQKSVAAYYAALMRLVEIANRLPPPRSAPPSQADADALVKALAGAQSKVRTPEQLQVKQVTFEWPRPDWLTVAIDRSGLPPYRLMGAYFFADAYAMRGVLLDIAAFVAKEAGPASAGNGRISSIAIHSPPRTLSLFPDWTADPGPDLFADTLLRALAGRDVRRIRRCPECPKLFIAVPATKTTCSHTCAVKRAGRDFRTREPGYYARAERAKRANRRAKCARRWKEKKS